MSTSRLGSRFHRQTIRHSMKPARQGCGLGDGLGLASQDEESSLKGIFRVMDILKNTLADAQNHRSVPVHQRSKRHVVTLDGEALQQLGIRQFGVARQGSQASDERQQRTS
jgi:hypothetical protein